MLFIRWCIHTVVLTEPKVGRNSILFYQRTHFYIIDRLSIAVHTFFMCMLTFLFVDEILLPRSVKWSTNFRSLPFNIEMASSCLKSEVTFLGERGDTTFRPFLYCVFSIHYFVKSKKYVVKFPCLPYFRKNLSRPAAFLLLIFFFLVLCLVLPL